MGTSIYHQKWLFNDYNADFSEFAKHESEASINSKEYQILPMTFTAISDYLYYMKLVRNHGNCYA